MILTLYLKKITWKTNKKHSKVTFSHNQGEIIFKKFKVGKQLGTGAFG